MGRSYSALDVAKYIINKCTTGKHPVSNLQLQKILYVLQRKYIVNNGRGLFDDEIQAWQFGPVVLEVYLRYCGFGSMDIVMNYNINIDTYDSDRIDLIIKETCCKKPWDLVKEIHSEGRAWAIIYNNGVGNHKAIPVDLIKTKG